MDKIQECAARFLNLVDTTSYVFHLSNRGVRVILLNFKLEDFHHLAGLQYLTDITIPRNRKKTIAWILDKNNPVTDKYLSKSKFYEGRSCDEKDIKNRIANLCFLENYLDENNIISIYSPKDGPQNNSLIKCDYIIESRLKELHTTVYIFIRQRLYSESSYGIISFGVKKNVSYGGRKLYWMLNDKIVNEKRITIFQNPKYTSEQKLKNEESKLDKNKITY